MIFISYRRDDAAGFVGLLGQALRYKFRDAEMFIDIQSLSLGVDFKESIIRAIWQSTIMIVVIGPKWNAADPNTKVAKLFSSDDVVRTEIEEGLKRKLLMIPIVLPGAAMPQPFQLPDSLHALCAKGARLFQPGDIDRQIESFVAEIGHRRLEILDELEAIADGLALEGSAKKALLFYNQAITLANENGRLYRKRAFVYEDLLEMSSALSDYKRAIKIDPSDALAWAGRSHHYFRTEQLELALSDINHAVNITISNPVAYSIRADIFWSMRRYLDCMKDLATCILLDPDNIDYRLRRIEAYIDLKHPELAQEDIKRVQALDPSNAKLRDLRLRL